MEAIKRNNCRYSNNHTNDATLKLFDRLNYESKGKNNGRIRSWVRSLACNILKVEGCVGSLGW